MGYLQFCQSLITSIRKALIFTGIYRYYFLFIPYFVFLSFIIIKNFSNNESLNKKEILPLIISVASISSAIIITYLFTKLFTERTSRIEYKKKIDELNIIINFFRILMHRIRSEDKLWMVNKNSIRYTLDNKLNWLTLEIYRGENNQLRLPYEKFEIINEQINGLIGQAYLAIKGFSDGDDSFTDYSDTNNRNYTLSDIIRYGNYQSIIWAYLDEYSNNDHIFNANEIHSMWFERMNEYYKKITNKKLKREKFKKQIKDLMTYFDENVFSKHYYFNTFLAQKFPVSFLRLFINIIINIVVLITSLLFFMINIPNEFTLLSILVSIFITNMLDLGIIILVSIPKELTINERYSI